MKQSRVTHCMACAIMMIPMLAKASQPVLPLSNDELPTSMVTSNQKAWDQVYGGSKNDAFVSVIQTSDGGYIAAGNTLSNADGELTDSNNGEQDALIVKFDSQGNSLWDQVYGGTNLDEFTSVIQTSDGGYLAVGYTRSNADGELTGTNNGYDDGLIVKFDSEGSPVWDKLYGGIDDDRFDSVIATNDGGYIAVGRSYNDGWLVKMDSVGDIQWQRTYGGSGVDSLYSVIETLDGGYVTAGLSYGAEDDLTDEYNGAGDGLLVKFDENGTPLWDQLYGGTAFDSFSSVTETTTGDYIVVGNTASDDGEINQNYNGYTAGLVAKFDSEGNPIWNNVYGEAFTTVFNSVVATHDGAYLVTGETNHDADDDNEQITDSSNGAEDAVVIKFNNEGNPIWDTLYGGSGSDNFTTIIATNDGGYIAAGDTNSEAGGEIIDSNNGERDGLLVKFQATPTPTQGWDQVYGGRSVDYFHSIIQASDGGYIAAGSTSSDADGELTDSNNGDFDGLLVKFDSEGNPLWDQVYGGSDYDVFSSVVQTSDGGYIVAGNTLSNTDGELTDSSNGYRDGLLVKFDNEGNHVWDKRYGGSGSDIFYSIIATNDGGYLAVGLSSSDAWSVKVDSVGNIQWEQTYDLGELFYSIIETSDGGYAAVGRAYSDDGLLVKLDENGNLLWDQLYGGSDSDEFLSVIETSAGEYIATGETESHDGDINENYDSTVAGLLAKFDNEGNPIWNKLYVDSGSSRLASITATNDGDYLVAGSTRSRYAALLVKFDSEGNQIWDELYGGGDGGMSYFIEIITTSDGSYVTAGSTSSDASDDITDSNNGEYDGLLVKFPAR